MPCSPGSIILKSLNYRQYSTKQKLVPIRNKSRQSNVICADFNHGHVWWNTATFKNKIVLKKYHFFSISVRSTRIQSCNPFQLVCGLLVTQTNFFSPEEYLQYHALTEIQCLLKIIQDKKSQIINGNYWVVTFFSEMFYYVARINRLFNVGFYNLIGGVSKTL